MKRFVSWWDRHSWWVILLCVSSNVWSVATGDDGALRTVNAAVLAFMAFSFHRNHMRATRMLDEVLTDWRGALDLLKESAEQRETWRRLALQGMRNMFLERPDLYAQLDDEERLRVQELLDELVREDA